MIHLGCPDTYSYNCCQNSATPKVRGMGTVTASELVRIFEGSPLRMTAVEVVLKEV